MCSQPGACAASLVLVQQALGHQREAWEAQLQQEQQRHEHLKLRAGRQAAAARTLQHASSTAGTGLAAVQAAERELGSAARHADIRCTPSCLALLMKAMRTLLASHVLERQVLGVSSCVHLTAHAEAGFPEQPP